MSKQAMYSPSSLEIFNVNKSQKIIDKLMTTDKQKTTIREFIERTAAEICGPVDYEFAWEALGLERFYFINMISIMGLEDLRAGLPSVDSLVTRKGNLMPSERHFELRIKENVLSPKANREEYHLGMIKRWCKVLGMDYEKYTSTMPYGKAPKNKARKNRRASGDRQSATRNHTLSSVSSESRATIKHAMAQPMGKFSSRELIRLQ
jgi:hypothetical protein